MMTFRNLYCEGCLDYTAHSWDEEARLWNDEGLPGQCCEDCGVVVLVSESKVYDDSNY